MKAVDKFKNDAANASWSKKTLPSRVEVGNAAFEIVFSQNHGATGVRYGAAAALYLTRVFIVNEQIHPVINKMLLLSLCFTGISFPPQDEGMWPSMSDTEPIRLLKWNQITGQDGALSQHCVHTHGYVYDSFYFLMSKKFASFLPSISSGCGQKMPLAILILFA